MSKRVLLAINNEKAEEIIRQKLPPISTQVGKEEHIVIEKIAIYKEQTIKLIEQEKPDIVVIVDSLKGSIAFQGLIHDIRSMYSNVRIVIISKKRERGDIFFKEMVRYGVYDIYTGESIELAEIFKMILEPKSLDYGLYLSGEELSTSQLQPVHNSSQPEVAIVDEKSPAEAEHKKGLFGMFKAQSKPVSQPATQSIHQSSQQAAVPVGWVNPQSSTPEVSQPVPVTTPVKASTSTLSSSSPSKPIFGTQVLDDSSNMKDGFVFMPYEIQPVVVTDFVTSEKLTVGANGEVLGKNLPIVTGPKPLINQNFENYAMSLLRQSNNQSAIPQHLAKTVVFTSVRQGSGCSTIALNTAFSLALKGHKVLFMDACPGRSSTFSRLEIPGTTDGINDALNYLKNGESILDVPLSFNKLIAHSTTANRSRFDTFPQSLSFIKYSDDFNSVNDSVVSLVPDMIRAFGQIYDYIVVDTSLMFFDSYTYKFLELADRVTMVTTQDLYELNLALDSLKNYEKIDIVGR